MGRPHRVEFAGAIFHVCARRVDRWPLFVDENDYGHYVWLLRLTVDRFDWILLSFCLMPNHIHLMIELREPNLAAGMHWLQSKYVRWFNDRHARVGRLFEDRYKPKLIEDELYFITVARYIEDNPVRAKLARRAEDWPWSSRGIVASGTHAPWIADDVLSDRRREITGL